MGAAVFAFGGAEFQRCSRPVVHLEHSGLGQFLAIQGSAMHDLPVPGGEFIQVDLLHVLTPFDNFAA